MNTDKKITTLSKTRVKLRTD